MFNGMTLHNVIKLTAFSLLGLAQLQLVPVSGCSGDMLPLFVGFERRPFLTFCTFKTINKNSDDESGCGLKK